MSSFFVGPETINATVSLILKAEGPRSLEEATKLGRSLWMMNALALEQRYSDEQVEDYSDALAGYRFEHLEAVPFVAIVKAANCFLHQCAEGQVPELSLYKKLTAITDRYADLAATAAYHAAPWGLCG